MAIKFISYTGKYPCLCSGILTVEIDGKEYCFGSEYDGKTTYPRFWASGGLCRFDEDFNPVLIKSDWEENHYWKSNKYIDEDKKQFTEKHIKELLSVMNANIDHGCCGGCL